MKKVIIAVFAIIIIACTPHNEEEHFNKSLTVSGTVEKGPFVQGSTINMQTMDGRLHATGNTFIESIKDDSGSFDFGSQEFDTPYAKLTATGYFFNEVTGNLSNGMINLNAIVDLSRASSVNVNLLTHLKSQRIQNLIESGKSFTEASNQSQQELMMAFGLQQYADKDVSQFSVSSGTDEAAALIAVSSIIQVGRSEASMTEFLSKLTNEFGDNGYFSDATKVALAESMNQLYDVLPMIADNVVSRYSELGRPITVKPLRYFFDWDGNGTCGDEILPEGATVSLDKPIINASAEGGTFTVEISSPIKVYLQETNNDVAPIGVIDVSQWNIYNIDITTDDWIQTSLNDNVLTVMIKPSTTRAIHNSVITLCDYLGTPLAEITVNQEANMNVALPGLNDIGARWFGDMIRSVGRAIGAMDQFERQYAHISSDGALSAPISASDNQILRIWNAMYAAVRSVNSFYAQDQGQLQLFGSFLDFYAALCYRRMINFWGDLIYFRENPTLSDTDYVRLDVNQIQNDLEMLLNRALGVAEDASYYGHKLNLNNKLNVPKNFIRILLGQLYMDMGNYQEAAVCFKDVYESGYYPLNEITPEISSTNGSCSYLFGLQKDNQSTQSNNDQAYVVVFSYVEVVLSYAECLFKLGDKSKAIDLIKKVSQAKGWNHDIQNEELIISYILQLRKDYKLPYHFDFLKRNNLAQSELGINNTNWLLFPLPASELGRMPSITQNPGY